MRERALDSRTLARQRQRTETTIALAPAGEGRGRGRPGRGVRDPADAKKTPHSACGDNRGPGGGPSGTGGPATAYQAARRRHVRVADVGVRARARAPL